MPFSVDEFFGVFARYNAAIWPLQVVAYLAGAMIVGLAIRRNGASGRVVLPVLAAMWLVNGIGYHLLHFAAINPVAPIFAALFAAEAAALAVAAVTLRELRFALRADASAPVAFLLIAFAMVIYPIWGELGAHPYPAAPVFGVAPCPTTIFTIGVLLLAPLRRVAWLLVVPGLWAAIGGSAAILLRVPQDYGLIAALAVLLLVFARDRRRAPH